ncbi:protein windbeutel [Topomyia yanbarensis]|uniref:protein windbeutel n=1 Tax=Topomyia yanbarensis TaxID=2498891 RepID=UPI00273BEFC6|nr:protein windbeutel [Topomyia yanbarensis]XP_058839159.1 protein windbeutel [Topomyia yanbarensis]
MWRDFTATVFFVFVHIVTSFASNGCVELNKSTFDKIVTRFKYTLVKFDVAFPYGDKHEAFIKFASEHAEENDDLLVALVSIKDYGDKENADLSQRFNIPEKYPIIKLFNNETFDRFIDFPEENLVTVDNLRKFVSTHTDLYIGLPGCLKEIDKLAAQFSDPSNTKETLKQIITDMESRRSLYSAEKTQKSYTIYLTFMSKMAQSNKSVPEFVSAEKERMQNLLKGKISDNKKSDLNLRLNIMESFRKLTPSPTQISNDEL